MLVLGLGVKVSVRVRVWAKVWFRAFRNIVLT